MIDSYLILLIFIVKKEIIQYISKVIKYYYKFFIVFSVSLSFNFIHTKLNNIVAVQQTLTTIRQNYHIFTKQKKGLKIKV